MASRTIVAEVHRPPAWRVFCGLLERDLLVTRKQLLGVMSQVLMQPLLMLLVFGKVLGALDYTPPSYTRLLLPGLMALNAFFAATQNASFPLAMEFTTRTIENRLRAPVTIPWLVAERIVAAGVRGIITAVLMAPIGALLLGELDWSASGLPVAFLFAVVGALTGGTVGVTIGSLVSPAHIGITFSLAMPPLLFTGSAQFPFPELTAVPWFQVLCALNPMTYVSEGLRGALTPEIPHIPLWLCASGLSIALLIFVPTSLWSFKRRAIV